MHPSRIKKIGPGHEQRPVSPQGPQEPPPRTPLQEGPLTTLGDSHTSEYASGDGFPSTHNGDRENVPNSPPDDYPDPEVENTPKPDPPTPEGLSNNPGEGTSGGTPALGLNPVTQDIPSDSPQEGEEPTPQEREEILQQTPHRRFNRPPDIPAIRGAVTAWISFFDVYRQ